MSGTQCTANRALLLNAAVVARLTALLLFSHTRTSKGPSLRKTDLSAKIRSKQHSNIKDVIKTKSPYMYCNYTACGLVVHTRGGCHKQPAAFTML